MVISCTVWGHWGKVAIAIDVNLLGMDPIHQEEARDLSSFLECVPVKVVDHSGHTLPLTVVVRDKSGRTTLDVFNFSYLAPWCMGSIRCNNILSVGGLVKCRLAVLASGRFL